MPSISFGIDASQAIAGARQFSQSVTLINRRAKAMAIQIDKLDASFRRLAAAEKGTAQQTVAAKNGLDKVAAANRKGKRASDGAGRSTNKLNKQLAQLSRTASFAIGPLSGVGARLRAIGSIVKAIGAPMAALLVTFVGFSFAIFKSIQVFKGFEKTLSTLSALTGFVGDELQLLSNAAQELGRATTLTASQVADGFRIIGSRRPELLKSRSALVEVSEAAIVLAEASGTTMQDAATSLTTALNQFQLPAEESGRLINVLAESARLGAATVPQLAEAMTKSGSTAKASGLSFEQTSAALEILAESGLKSTEFGTSFRNILLQLTTATAKFNPLIGDKGLAGALRNVQAAGLDAQEFLRLFGRRQVNLARLLVANVDRYEELVEGITDTNSAYEAQGRATNNLEDDLKKFISQLQGLGIAIGEIVTPAVREMIQAFTSGLSVINDFITKLRNPIVARVKVIVEEGEEAGVAPRFALLDEINRIEQQLAELENPTSVRGAGSTVAGSILESFFGYDYGAKLRQGLIAAREEFERLNKEATKDTALVQVQELAEQYLNLEDKIRIATDRLNRFREGGEQGLKVFAAEEKAKELVDVITQRGGPDAVEALAKAYGVAQTDVAKAMSFRILAEIELNDQLERNRTASRERIAQDERAQEFFKKASAATDTINAETEAMVLNEREQKIRIDLIRFRAELEAKATDATRGAIDAQVAERAAALRANAARKEGIDLARTAGAALEKEEQRTRNLEALTSALSANSKENKIQNELLELRTRLQNKGVEEAAIQRAEREREAILRTNQARREELEQYERVGDIVAKETTRTANLKALTTQLELNSAELKIRNELLELERLLADEGVDNKIAKRLVQEREEALRTNQARREEIETRKKLNEQIKRETENRAAEYTRAIQQPFINAAEGMQEAFSSTFRSIFDDGFSSAEDFGDKMLDLVKDLAAEMATLLIFKPVLQGVAGGGLKGGGLLSGLFGGGASGGSEVNKSFDRFANAQATALDNKLRDVFGEQTTLQLSGNQIASTTAGNTGGILNSMRGLPDAISKSLGGILVGAGVGAGIGGTAGGIIGSIAGGIGKNISESIFSEEGGILGKIAGPLGGIAGGILGGLAGKLFQPDRSREDVIQGAGGLGGIIGGVTASAIASFTGGGLAAVGASIVGTGGGAAAGALAGSVVPIIGTIIGALFGFILGSLFGPEELKPFVQITSKQIGDEINKATATTPFGTISVAVQDLQGNVAERTLEIVKTLDFAIASVLTDAEQFIAGTPGAQINSRREIESGGDIYEALADRYRSIIRSLGVDPSRFLPGGQASSTEAVFAGVQQFIDERRELFGTLELLKREEIPNFTNEMAKLAAEFEAATEAARNLGINAAEVTSAFQEGVSNLQQQFQRGVRFDILDIVDPFVKALEDIDLARDLRLQEAESLGVGLLEIEKFYALARREALEEEIQPLTDFFTELRRGEAGQLSGTALLGFDQSQFDAVLARYAENNASISDVVSAASTLLQTFESTFGRTAAFDAQQAEIERILIAIQSERTLTAGGDPSIPEVALRNALDSGPVTVQFSSDVPDVAIAEHQIRIANSVEAGNAEIAALLREQIEATARNTAELALLREDQELSNAAAVR